MLTQQRHEIILELLREKGSITVTEVKDLFRYIRVNSAKRYHCTG